MADFRWTAEQAEAIASPEDTLLVANAGTGKTTTVVGKILWLLGFDVGIDRETGDPIPGCEKPCELHEIAAITFTEKAAYDLKRKLRREIGRSDHADELRWEVDRATVGTIHSFCGSLLREHSLRLRIDPTFRVLDEGETRQELDEVVRDVVLKALEEGYEDAGALFRDKGLRGYRGGGLLDLVAAAMRDLRWRPDHYDAWTEGEALSSELLREACDRWTAETDDLAVERCAALLRLGHRALRRWEALLEEENARDFDALILDARRLLCASEGRAAVDDLRRRYRIVIVDEFQDTDRAQRDIVYAIARGVPRPQLFLVGDPKQSIYRFRGADVSVWNEVEEEMRKDGRVRPLTRNFRSTPAIIDFANQAGRLALEDTGAALDEEVPGGRIEYAELDLGRTDAERGAVEWLAARWDGKADDRRRAEGRSVAGRIQEMVGTVEIPDPDTGGTRLLQHRDVAILYRTGTGIPIYEDALREYGIPYHNSAPPVLGDRQEVADLLNALRLVENPRDDLRAFAFLRSPFVSLRDETLARIRLLNEPGSLLRQARRYLSEGQWWAPPEHPAIVDVERESLRRGLEVLDEARSLSSRVPLDELARLILHRSGYLAHLVILGRHRDAVAHLQTFVRQLEEHRDLLPGRFLEMWDRREEADLGLPSAPLHSREDDVVTFSTMHRAKGLEWPVVFLVDLSEWKIKHASGKLVTDRELGPILMPNKGDRGDRAAWLHDRWQLQEAAEEARVLYVAITRARERLIVVSDENPSAQLTAFLARGRGEEVELRTAHAPEPAEDTERPPSLEWLDREGEKDLPSLARPLPRPELRATTSATELMMKAEHPERWELRYVHGVQAPWEFAPDPAGGGDPVPARVRGSIIHGVLERIEEASELARILDEAVGELDNPELETHLSRGTPYREALDREIRRVVESEEWAWYLEGEHHRELPFVNLSVRPWRLGSFDLYRPRDELSWIIDFKTHEIGPDEVESVAEEYDIQADVYTSAASVAGPVRMQFHFTHPNQSLEIRVDGSE